MNADAVERLRIVPLIAEEFAHSVWSSHEPMRYDQNPEPERFSTWEEIAMAVFCALAFLMLIGLVVFNIVRSLFGIHA